MSEKIDALYCYIEPSNIETDLQGNRIYPEKLFYKYKCKLKKTYNIGSDHSPMKTATFGRVLISNSIIAVMNCYSDGIYIDLVPDSTCKITTDHKEKSYAFGHNLPILECK